jgi:hypothetical protein
MKKATSSKEAMVLVAMVLTVVSLGGCGSGSSSRGDALCNEIIQARCDKLFSCAEASDMAKSDVGGSKAQCVSDMGIFCTWATASGCTAGRTYSADKAQQCADQTKSGTCAASFGSNGYLMDPDACVQVCSIQ